MGHEETGARAIVRRLWTASPPLTATAGLMLLVLAGTVAGLVVDPRVITGAPAWLKPAKFAISIAIYAGTLAWVFSLMPEWVRMRRFVGTLSAVVLILEMVIIAGQAARGTTSHFNIGTPLDATLFGLMGTAIVIQTVTSIAVLVAAWRHGFADAALGWAIRFGLAITIVGAFTGGLMTRPTSTQMAAMGAGERVTIVGGHTVGAPDGGAGLPGTGWSTQHGDVRVPHCIGLHALQVLPLIALWLARRRTATKAREGIVKVAAASYATLYGILLWEALRGQPVLTPDSTTAAALGLWAMTTVVAVIMIRRRPAIGRGLATV